MIIIYYKHWIVIYRNLIGGIKKKLSHGTYSQIFKHLSQRELDGVRYIFYYNKLCALAHEIHNSSCIENSLMMCVSY